jgi:hypothetical protein
MIQEIRRNPKDPKILLDLFLIPRPCPKKHKPKTIITTTTTSIHQSSSIIQAFKINFLVFDNANVADIALNPHEIDKENATVAAAVIEGLRPSQMSCRSIRYSQDPPTRLWSTKDTPSQYYQGKSISRMDLGIAKVFAQKKPLENRLTELSS